MRLPKRYKEYFPAVFIFHDIKWDYTCKGRKPMGGRCTVYLLLGKGVGIAGQAVCRENDQYSKRIGKSIAYGRALRAVQELGGEKMVETVNSWASEYIGKINPAVLLSAYNGQSGKGVI